LKRGSKEKKKEIWNIWSKGRGMEEGVRGRKIEKVECKDGGNDSGMEERNTWEQSDREEPTFVWYFRYGARRNVRKKVRKRKK
jgi:hypothetical protein